MTKSKLIVTTALALLMCATSASAQPWRQFAPDQRYDPTPQKWWLELQEKVRKEKEAARQTARAEAASPEFQQYCTRLSNYAGAIVDYRDAGMFFDEAVEAVFQSEWDRLSANGGDLRIESMPQVKIYALANTLVAKAYLPPYPTITEVRAAIRTDCVNEPARKRILP